MKRVRDQKPKLNSATMLLLDVEPCPKKQRTTTLKDDMLFFEILAPEMVIHIFHFLDSRWNPVIRSVCRGWDDLLAVNLYGKDPPSDFIVKWAIQHNKTGLLVWICANRCTIRDVTAIEAVKVGNLKMLEILYKYNCAWTGNITGAAAKMGRRDLLDWLEERCCPITEATVLDAIEGGQTDLLPYLETKAKIKQQVLAPKLVKRATEHGQTPALQYLIAKGYHVEGNFVVMTAIKHNQTKVLKWAMDHLYNNNNDYTGHFCVRTAHLKEAIIHGAVESARYLFQYGYKKRLAQTSVYRLFHYAIKNGDLAILDSLWENLLSKLFSSDSVLHISSDRIFRSNTKDKKGLVDWLEAHNFSINDLTCFMAIQEDNVEMLDWIYTTGRDMDLNTKMTISAISQRAMPIVRWLWNHESSVKMAKDGCDTMAL